MKSILPTLGTFGSLILMLLFAALHFTSWIVGCLADLFVIPVMFMTGDDWPSVRKWYVRQRGSAWDEIFRNH